MNKSRSGSSVLHTNGALRNEQRRETRANVEREREAGMDDCKQTDRWVELEE